MTKPERVETGQRWKDGHGPYAITAVVNNYRYAFRRDDGSVGSMPERDCLVDPTGCDEYLGTAPATPGTATATPAPHDQTTCMYCAGGIACPEFAKLVARVRIPAEKLFPASKPPAPPVYGRLVGELRAPDGTPRTALEAIQAKREPEPWLPSCDIDCDIPDADEGWRR